MLKKTNKSSKTTFSLNSLKYNQKNNILNQINLNYDSNIENLKEYYFYINNKNKIFISKIDLSSLYSLRVVNIGIYFGTLHDNNNFRLSIEGSQLITPKKNYIEITEETLKSYLAAENIFTDEVLKVNTDNLFPFLIVKFKNNNLGCVSKKDKFYLNYLPKTRKLNFNKLF